MVVIVGQKAVSFEPISTGMACQMFGWLARRLDHPCCRVKEVAVSMSVSNNGNVNWLKRSREPGR